MSRVFDVETTPLEGTMILEASAGTGKTYALEHIIARLVGRKTDPLDIGEILVVTFTNRAAREMKERIRRLLERFVSAALSPDERVRYMRALSGFDRANITTIHGFCRGVLKTWPFESSSLFDLDFASGGDLEYSAARFWLASLPSGGGDTADRTYNDCLAAAYSSAGSVDALAHSISRELRGGGVPPGALLLPSREEIDDFLAYAESSENKDSALSAAVAGLLDAQWSIEAVNGLWKSAGVRTRGRSGDRFKELVEHIEASRGLRGLLSLSRTLLPCGSSLKIHEDFRRLMALAVAFSRGQAPNPERADAGLTAPLAGAFDRLFQAMEPYVEIVDGQEVVSLVDDYLNRSFFDNAVRHVRPRVEELKESQGVLDFDDMIVRVADTVRYQKSPLRALIRSTFRVALIDEFQDTDPRQWELFCNVFADPPHFLAMIGDPKQCIYGFRGTGLQAYSAARATVKAENLYRLDTNYRSAPPLVQAMNTIFKPVFESGCLDNPPVGFDPVRAGRQTDRTLHRPDGNTPVVLCGCGMSRKDGEEWMDVVAEIRRILDPHTGGKWHWQDGRRTSVEPSDIAVLCSSNEEVGGVRDSISSYGIPAVQIRSCSIFESPVVEYLRGFLLALENPKDTGCWKALLLGGLFRVPPALLCEFEEREWLDELVEQGALWRKTVLQGRCYQALDSLFDYSRVLADWSRRAGRQDCAHRLKRSWRMRILCLPGGERLWQDWNQLCDLVQGRQAEGVLEPGRLVEWLDEAGGVDSENETDAVRLESELPAVRVMTIHMSKGLEFPIVFVLGGLAGRKPNSGNSGYKFGRGDTLVVDWLRRNKNRQAHLAYEWEETKRLLYVAFTRASDALWIMRPSGGNVRIIDSLLAESLGIVGTDSLPAHFLLGKNDADNLRSRIDACLSSKERELDSLIEIRVGGENEICPLPGPPAPSFSLVPPPDRWTGERDPAISSYTSIVRSFDNTDDEFTDRDLGSADGPQMPSNESEQMILEDSRGVLFGSLVHAVFEHCDFSKARSDDEQQWMHDQEIENVFSTQAGRHYSPYWYESRRMMLKTMVRRVLRAPVPDLGRLCDLEAHQYKTEVEFLVTLPRNLRFDSDGLDVTLRSGYLKGFIDLLVRVGGRWWIVDWKTNLPENTRSVTSYNDVDSIMKNNHYILQYELYMIALCRTLAAAGSLPVGWNDEIGGAVYLFVRGLRERDRRGIFMAKPSKERILTLSRAMGLDGIIA